MIESALAYLGLKWSAVVGGLAGALCSLKLFNGLLSWRQRMTTVGFGWLCAAFTAVLIVELAGMNEKHLLSVSYLIGLLGLAVAYNIFKAIPEWVAGAKSIVFGRLNKGGSDGADTR